MGEWNNEYIIIIEIARRAAANGLYKPIDPDVGGDKTFTYAWRLSATGLEPATHLAVQTRATGPMVFGIHQAFEAAPWAQLFAMEAGGTITGMDFAGALDFTGLSVITETEMDPGPATKIAGIPLYTTNAGRRATLAITDRFETANRIVRAVVRS